MSKSQISPLDEPLNELRRCAALYMQQHGEQGLQRMGEDLCRIVAGEVAGESAWTDLALHIQRISG